MYMIKININEKDKAINAYVAKYLFSKVWYMVHAQ